MEIKHLNARQVAEYLNASISWVYTNAGLLGASKIGGKLLFPAQEIENAMQRGRVLARKGNYPRKSQSGSKRNRASGNRLGAKKPQSSMTREELAKRAGLDHLL